MVAAVAVEDVLAAAAVDVVVVVVVVVLAVVVAGIGIVLAAAGCARVDAAARRWAVMGRFVEGSARHYCVDANRDRYPNESDCSPASVWVRP